MTDSVEFIKGIGPKKSGVLQAEAGIETIEDLLYYLPRRYIDRSAFRQIKDCLVDEIVTISGTVTQVRVAGYKKKYLEVEITDGSDALLGVFFGGIQYLRKRFVPGDFVLFSGTIKFFKRKQIVHPEFDFLDVDSSLQSINTGRIIPLYRSTEALKEIGLHSRGFRRLIRTVIDDHLENIPESIPASIIDRYTLIGIQEALFAIHFPDSFEQAELARKRLSFNEVFFLQYYLALSKRYLKENCDKEPSELDEPGKSLLAAFHSGLSFPLTTDQEKAIEVVKQDILSPYPMNRLLQGDVGSGKTVVAMASSLIAIGIGAQAAFMAPTEVLAVQHYNSLVKMMPPGLSIELLTGSTPKSSKNIIYQKIEKGHTHLVIGTHALIQAGVSFKNLGLIIIDEQHRFGVEQRALLRSKGENTDLLVMTATPIPRSLSMTLYGDLEVSSIKMKPANRLPIKTYSFEESRLKGVYNSMEKYISQGRQVYYVLPLIEESEKIDLKSAIEVYENLSNTVFSHRTVELLHGRMKQAEKESIMERYNAGEIDILVSTTVIEVGIDVSNATVIIIEHAERFGLSQLHQLRGRVGRGEHQSFCALVHPDKISADSKKRIEVLVSTDDGFAISEEDLKLRGAGELIGSRQHGQGDFEFTDLAKDIDIIIDAREEAGKEVSKISEIAAVLDNLKSNKKYEPIIAGIRKKRILSILS
ncbi:MAG: ATP-dependent DNA helicase RecG [bacterium]|nr:ATP-dependent DNA helicase RecG [bacterium]